MKKILLLITFFTIVNFAFSEGKKDIADFIAQANVISGEMEKIQEKLNNEKTKYEIKIKKVEDLKNKKNKFFLFNFINDIFLKYYLGGANASAFKISNLTKKQRELNNDYFTLVSLITTEYGEKIRDCIKNQCPDLKELYDSRIK